MAIFAAVALDAASARPTTHLLKRFVGTNGANPQGALLVGASGALFGTTTAGGHFGSGMVFELIPPATGQTFWTEAHLYDFCSMAGCVGGTLPVAGLTPDGAGGFFGTTTAGGGHSFGAVFQLHPPAAGTTRWSLDVLYEFCAEKSCRDGGSTAAAVLRGPGGVLYGTTFTGGAHTYGTVFSLAPPASGHTGWSYAVIHDFDFHDGEGPLGRLTSGINGELYGTTSAAGANGHGTAFKLTPPTAGGPDWSFRVIYQFCAETSCRDGADPNSGLLRGKGGTLYGTTLNGGLGGSGVSGGWGTVYALIPPNYRIERVLHKFAFFDGAAPIGGLIEDRSGALYGTTSMDGAYGSGTVFKLARSTGPAWTETVLHDFAGPDGSQPVAALVMGSGGVLYGTTEFGGGVNDDGVVFAVTP